MESSIGIFNLSNFKRPVIIYLLFLVLITNSVKTTELHTSNVTMVENFKNNTTLSYLDYYDKFFDFLDIINEYIEESSERVLEVLHPAPPVKKTAINSMIYLFKRFLFNLYLYSRLDARWSFTPTLKLYKTKVTSNTFIGPIITLYENYH